MIFCLVGEKNIYTKRFSDEDEKFIEKLTKCQQTTSMILSFLIVMNERSEKKTEEKVGIAFYCLLGKFML